MTQNFLSLFPKSQLNQHTSQNTCYLMVLLKVMIISNNLSPNPQRTGTGTTNSKLFDLAKTFTNETSQQTC